MAQRLREGFQKGMPTEYRVYVTFLGDHSGHLEGEVSIFAKPLEMLHCCI